MKMGITNVEEFSLLVEGQKEDKEDADKMGTIKRDKSVKDICLKKMEERDKKKMDQLKKKLHTDDEVHWLGHDKTLREQGVDDTCTVLLRRKYFYSDQSGDIKDPVQLGLLYVQCRDGILDGTHPCTQEEASQLGAIQIQVQFGDFEEGKYKFIDLKEFLPKEYVKSKNIDKKIKEEHKKASGHDELQAKYKYVQLCQGLKTYGVTFFLVKEKMKGKNKLVHRLLGVTKESILRVDEKTKEVMKTWPLTTVRRWAASPNSFTLDFGDYLESYYSVQTNEGEKISQFIAGYIDIMLKKRKGQKGDDPDFDKESTMVEDSVTPSKDMYLERQTDKVGHAATGSVALPAVMRAGGPGASRYSMGKMEPAQYGTVTGSAHSARRPPMGSQAKLYSLTSVQKAYMSSLSHGLDTIVSAEQDLGSPAEIPALGSDPASLKWKQNTLDLSRQNVASRLAALSACCASIVTLTSGEPEETNYTAAGAAVNTISSNLQDLSKGIKMIAGLLDDDDNGKNLLDATRGLAGAFSNLLKAAQEGGGADIESRGRLLSAAGNVGSSGATLLQYMGEPEVDQQTQEMLLALAQAVANATASLVLKAKNVAIQSNDTGAQSKVINAVKETARTTAQLVACVKVVVPSVSSHMCQEQVVEAAKLVATAVDDTEGAFKEAAPEDSDLLRELMTAAQAVRDAMNSLLVKVRNGGWQAQQAGKYDAACDDILGATDRLFNSMGNAGEMVKQARILAQASSSLVTGIKAEAETQDDLDAEKRLLGAAKVLADATLKLVEAAKEAAKNPNAADQQQKLKQAAEDLRSATNAAARDALKKKLVKRLEAAAKEAAGQATQLIAAARSAGPSNRNQASQQQLSDQCKPVEEHINQLVEALRDTARNPDIAAPQLGLINASKEFIQPTSKLVANSKAALPTIGDPITATQLANFAKSTASSLGDLRDAADKAAEACGTLEIDSALDTVGSLGRDLEAYKKSAEEGKLLPLPGDTAESCGLELGATSKSVGSSMAQLLTAASQAAYLVAVADPSSVAGRPGLIDQAQFINSKQEIVEACQSLLNPEASQQQVLGAATSVAKHTSALCNACKAASAKTDNPAAKRQLMQSGKDVANNTATLVKNIKALASDMSDNNREACAASTKPLINSVESLTAYALSPEFAPVPAKISEEARSAQVPLIMSGKSMATSSTDYFNVAKALAVNNKDQTGWQQLAQQAKAVSDAMRRLITAIKDNAPGQRECDEALEQINQTINQLDQASLAAISEQLEPRPENSLRGFQEQMMQNLFQLSDVIDPLAIAAKSEPEHIGHRVAQVSCFITPLPDLAVGAASHTADVQRKVELLDQAKTVAESAAQLMYATKEGGGNPQATDVHPEIDEAAQGMKEAVRDLKQTIEEAASQSGAVSGLIDSIDKALAEVSHLLAAPQQGSRGTQACINAASAVQGIVSDLDTTVMFAATGTLHPETEGDTFGDHREAILRTAKTLVEDTKNLVSAAQASQDVLASAAQSAVGSVSKLADNVKLGALALGPDDSDAQQMLLNAAKDVASALGALINATKNASGKSANDPSMEVLKTTGKTMVTNVFSLLKTVKSVEDKALRGTRAL